MFVCLFVFFEIAKSLIYSGGADPELINDLNFPADLKYGAGADGTKSLDIVCISNAKTGDDVVEGFNLIELQCNNDRLAAATIKAAERLGSLWTMEFIEKNSIQLILRVI